MAILLQVDESTERSVVLKNVSEETSGIFKCEVMGEGPSFRTAVETKAMNVVGECRARRANLDQMEGGTMEGEAGVRVHTLLPHKQDITKAESLQEKIMPQMN